MIKRKLLKRSLKVTINFIFIVWYNLTLKLKTPFLTSITAFLNLRANFIKILVPASIKELTLKFHVWNVSTYPTVYWYMFAVKKFDMTTHSVKYGFSE